MGSEDAYLAPAAEHCSELRESVMHKRAMTATMAALSALFLAALPVSADTEYALTPTTMDWRLVVVFSLLGVLAFHLALELVNRGR
jgi:hypothetical protein